MNSILSEAFYTDVTAEQKERLKSFRMMHPREYIDLEGIAWSYVHGGQGAETILLLPGGERIGDIGFPFLQEFEQEYRWLYPSYPPLPTMNALLDGLAALLDRLGIERVILFAASFGGDVGQCFVRKYPQKVSKLILLNTGLQTSRLVGQHSLRSRW